MNLPLSNAEKLAESSRREEEFRREREREELVKAYHEREPRIPLTSQQRKGDYKIIYSFFECHVLFYSPGKSCEFL